MGVVPLIIRDTKNAFSDPMFDDVLEVNLASIHLPFRLALYERAHLNFMKNNGPATLLLFSRSPSMHLVSFDNSSKVVSKDWFNLHYGMTSGDQFPMSTIETEYVWDSEDPNYVINSVRERLKSQYFERTPHKFTGEANAAASFVVAMRHFIENIKFGFVMKEDADLLKRGGPFCSTTFQPV